MSIPKIRTTHVGSLIRPPQLLPYLSAILAGNAYDETAFQQALTASVATVVKQQAEIGIDIVKRALEEPLRLIASNAGHEGAVVVEKVRNNNNAHFGFDAQSETYSDLVEAGVIDPTKVTRTALQNAASIASLMLTTEAMVSEIPEPKSAPAGGGHGGGMEGMY